MVSKAGAGRQGGTGLWRLHAAFGIGRRAGPPLEGLRLVAIRKSPAAGEFRFLSVAMKTRTAKGIMIEFAADGVFPPEDKPIRTYYAGENSTGWVSNELAKDVPTDWQTFTIDLWADNGDFTLTGVAFTPMGAIASYDRLELLRAAPQRDETNGGSPR